MNNVRQKFLVYKFAAVLTFGLSALACSPKSTSFEKVQQEPQISLSEIAGSTDESDTISLTEITEVPVNKPPIIAEPPVENLEPLSVSGLATGVASQTNPYQWENWAPKGTTIQLSYSIAGQNSVSTAFQIVKKGSVVRLGEAVNSSVLATDEQGKPYAFAQYFNLELAKGSYLFNLPLRYKMNQSSIEQILKVGQYDIYITACSTLKLNSCKISEPISFEVR